MRRGPIFVGKQAGSPRDLPAFYEHVIAAIRAVDGVTPVTPVR
jgi:hypothetical protein